MILVKNRDLFISPRMRHPRQGGPRRIIVIPFGVEKLVTMAVSLTAYEIFSVVKFVQRRDLPT